ncbi:MAG: cyclic nucleotide-binding/CBS domain-containing protein [Nitrospinales bacterium]
MCSPILSIDSEKTIREAAKLMLDKGTRSILVKENGEYVGIATKTDFILRVYIDENMDPDLDVVSDVMTKHIESLDLNSSMEEARKFMQKKKIGHLGVTENEKIVGILSKKDLMTYFGKLT